MSNSLQLHGLCSPWNSPGQNTGMGNLSFFQGIFQSQGSNPSLPHCRPIVYQLSHKGSPRILEWVTYPFSSGSSWSRNRTRVSCIAGGFFTNDKGSPRILEWVANSFSRGSSWPRKWTRVSWIAGGFYTSWATREALILCIKSLVLIYLITESLYLSPLLTSGNCKADLLFYELFVFVV